MCKARAEKEAGGKKVSCFLFTPDYNSIDLIKYKAGAAYKVIKYSQLYDFYNAHAGEMIDIEYFRDFLGALRLQSETVDNSYFRVMKQRFVDAIKRANEK